MCECNESPFNKLRESWSRHYNKEMQGKCDCCCQDTKPKIKGKFGVAYVIETPTRKCKPCGWEVEFNDTPSQIDNNCEKMMNWITCPPLGGCQNNHTNLCCCSARPKEILNSMKQTCCKPPVKPPLCSCCKEKCSTSGGDFCCKKPKRTCCRQKEVSRNQCCPKTNNNQKQCCSKAKAKPNNNCCRGQQEYFKSKNKCAKCCCTVRTNDKPCCCLFQKEGKGCCCSKITKPLQGCQSDSQSSTEDCECQNGRKLSNKTDSCSCNCSACKCFAHTKTQTQSRHTQPDQLDAAHKSSTDKLGQQQPSKNGLSLEPKKEKQKPAPRSPYTISTVNVPKKDPDKKDFHGELTQAVMKRKKPDTKPEIDTEIKNTDYEKLEKPYEEVKGNKEPNEKEDAVTPPKKKIKGAALLKKVKQERRKEMQAIHPEKVN